MEEVTDLFLEIDKWITEYCTTNTDYPDGYIHCVKESSYTWPERIERWCKDNFVSVDLVPILKDLITEWDLESVYDMEYSDFRGNGLCLWSLNIGEYHNEIEINQFELLKKLHEEEILDKVLDCINCDVSVTRFNGTYKRWPNETYNRWNSEVLYLTHYINGQWHYFVPDSRMRELVAEATIILCRKLDS